VVAKVIENCSNDEMKFVLIASSKKLIDDEREETQLIKRLKNFSLILRFNVIFHLICTAFVRFKM
jgi:hypothetical protein